MGSQEQSLLGCREKHGTRMTMVTSMGRSQKAKIWVSSQVRSPGNSFSPRSLGSSRSQLCLHLLLSQVGTTQHLKPS